MIHVDAVTQSFADQTGVPPSMLTDTGKRDLLEAEDQS